MPLPSSLLPADLGSAGISASSAEFGDLSELVVGWDAFDLDRGCDYPPLFDLIGVETVGNDPEDHIADGSRTPEWYEAVQAASKTTDGPVGEGTHYTFTRALPQGEVVNDVEVSEFEKPNLVEFTSRSGPTPFVYRYRVEPAGTGSRVILEGSITGEGLRGRTALLAPLAGKLFARGMTQNLKALKARLER